MISPQREIITRKTIQVWAPAQTGAVTFDLTDTIYGGLDFVPDAFYVKEVSYISVNENNSNAINSITVNFASPNNIEIPVGTLSAGGSINHPNTLYTCNFLNGELGQNAQFRLVELSTIGQIDNTGLNKSSWFISLEFIRYATGLVCS